MTRRKVAGLARADNLEAAADTVRFIIGAAELDPDQVPWEAVPDKEYHAFVEGTDSRPTWSQAEAGKIAKALLETLELRHMINHAVKARGAKGGVSMPQYLKVQVCPKCNELQTGSSRADRRNDECGTCALRCPEFSSHKANQINCALCKSELVELWRTTDPIPKAWL